MSTVLSAAPSPPPEYTPEAWQALRDAVAGREAESARWAAALQDPVVATAWAAHQEAVAQATAAFERGVRGSTETSRAKYAVADGLRSRHATYGGALASSAGARTATTAIVLGELRRLARVAQTDTGAVAADGAGHAVPAPATGAATGAGTAPAPGTPRATTLAALGPEQHLAFYYPVLARVLPTLHRQAGTRIPQGTDLPVPVLTQAVQDLLAVQTALGTGRQARLVVPGHVMSQAAGALAGPGVLGADQFAPAMEAGHEAHWHVRPHTRHPGGGFVEALRTRIRREGSPELLVALAGSSDGQNRAVAGGAPGVPAGVYEYMIYDNSLAVLSEVVQNPQFNDYRAYAMIDTGLAPQITAVMLHGRVNTGIRATAAERAIAHEGVDPMHIYTFLSAHRDRPEVPHALWRDYARALHGRLHRARAAGQDAVAGRLEKRLGRVLEAFVNDLLRPYAEAVAEVERHAPAAAPGADPSAPAASSYAHWRQQAMRQKTAYVTANEFVKDVDLLDLLAEGQASGEALLEVLRLHLAARLPAPKRLVVRLMQHESREVRLAAVRMAPALSEAGAAAMAEELQARLERDYATLRETVFTDVIPDYERIEAEPRRVSRMRHHFTAAVQVPLETLVRTFVTAARQDPRGIPDAFRRLTEGLAVQAGTEADAQWPEAEPEGRTVVQASLFGEGEGVSPPPRPAAPGRGAARLRGRANPV